VLRLLSRLFKRHIKLKAQYTPIKSGDKIIPKKAASIKNSKFLKPAITPNYNQLLSSIGVSRLK
jgi:hypothetical protein